MTRNLILGLLALCLALPGLADDKKAKTTTVLAMAADAEPIVFGMAGQNTGCVIFKEYVQKKVLVLEEVEAQNYDLQQKKWLEDPDSSSELLNLAVKDHLRFVKIPEKYKPEQLERARAACKESVSSPQPEKPRVD